MLEQREGLNWIAHPLAPSRLGGGISHWPAAISSPPHGRGLRGGRSKIIVSFNRARRKPDSNAYIAGTGRQALNCLSTFEKKRASMLYKVPLVLSPQAEGGFTVTSPLLPELMTEDDT